MDYLTHLASDYRRLADVSAGHLADQVPTCPEWTVDDLVRHVAMVYLHKVECMRQLAAPDPWPPDTSGEPALDLLSRAHAALVQELAARPAASAAWTWYGPDQTVGFWQRRMAQETVIHRIDAELGAGALSLPIPDGLALDGIDEVLVIFLAWASTRWPEDFAEPLSHGDGSVLISAGGRGWLVTWDSAGARVSAVTAPSASRLAEEAVAASGGLAPVEPDFESAVQLELSLAPQAVVTGSPEAMLRWLWRRATDEVIRVSGDVRKVAQMRALLGAATQ